MLIINTGGTFNKRYNPLNGELEVPKDSLSLKNILKYFYNLEYSFEEIIFKDSLDMTNNDRKILAKTVENSKKSNILIVHGTDTMDITAQFLEKQINNKCIVLTGAMVPYSIDAIEANANFSMALGYLMNNPPNGVYIAMHGLIDRHNKVYKNRKIGIFEKVL
jgi:L-asparaginase